MLVFALCNFLAFSIFLHDLWQWIPKPAKIIAEKIPQCFTLLLNFMVTEKQFKPPIFVSGRSSEPWIPHRNYSLCLREVRVISDLVRFVALVPI